MSPIKEVEKESQKFSKQLRFQQAINVVAILVGALIYIATSPESMLEYLSFSLLIMPIMFWAQQIPKNKKTRVVTSIFCFIASMVIYIFWVLK